MTMLTDKLDEMVHHLRVQDAVVVMAASFKIRVDATEIETLKKQIDELTLLLEAAVNE